MLFYFACEAAGASSARHSLRPLFKGKEILANLGHIVSRDRETVSTSLRGAQATKQSTLTCFAARWIASLALAMTVVLAV
jgi:hypothetical protein